MDNISISRQLRKIQAVVDLLTSHENIEFAQLGELLSDLLHPVLEHFSKNQ